MMNIVREHVVVKTGGIPTGFCVSEMVSSSESEADALRRIKGYLKDISDRCSSGAEMKEMLMSEAPFDVSVMTYEFYDPAE